MTQLLDRPVWRDHLSPYAAELLPQVAAIAREITQTIHARVPEIGSDPVLASFTEPSAAANIALVLSMIRDGRDADGVEPPPSAITQARAYVASGGDLAALQRTYRVGHEVFWSRFVQPLRERIPDTDEHTEAVSLISRFLFSYIDGVSQRLVDIFAVERGRSERTAAAVRADTVREILAGGPTDLTTAGRRLGYDLNRTHLAFIVWSDPTEDDVLGMLEERAARIAAAFGARTSLLVPLGRLTTAGWIATAQPVAPVTVTLRSEDPTAPAVRAAVGTTENGLDGFRSSHAQAQHARRVAELTGLPSGQIEYYDRIALIALTTQDPGLSQSFISAQLGPLANADASSARLAETLGAYLAEGCSPARTAKRLGVHENTVANRIARAEKLIGHRIDAGRLELAVALRLHAALSGHGRTSPSARA